MLAHHGSHGDAFGRAAAPFPPRYLNLEQIQLPGGLSTATRKAFRSHNKLRVVTSPTGTAYRPPTTRTKKSVRPKQEPASPAMSGYSYSSSDQGQGTYSYTPPYQAGVPTAVPQYTQTQINTYYAQYQCYPPQPYHVIPDYYVQPVTVAPTGFQQPVAGAYDTPHWQTQVENLNLPHSHGPSRSNSRTRTWTCDIPSCTSSANFTRLADLQRHQSTVHGVGTPEYPCTVAHCNRVGDKGFTRRDHLVEHLRNFHHMDIPKRRPGERSAFPFGWPESGGSGAASQ
ncbi:hypothetical protein BDW02DRAFT_493376 [Decorospora gaudefroyi]|uniref:C2H2-type domain-containing protein n=1 Tax=Decorospora gaudefroyi TaxID=184978 RepID=A0A6A5KMK7_9PLEO|nr:hypothetical protein BDW02DRAFT_493376 [Decorospora gaudefroyi]